MKDLKKLSQEIAEDLGLGSLSALVIEMHLRNAHHDGWTEGFNRASNIADNVISGNKKPISEQNEPTQS